MTTSIRYDDPQIMNWSHLVMPWATAGGRVTPRLDLSTLASQPTKNSATQSVHKEDKMHGPIILSIYQLHQCIFASFLPHACSNQSLLFNRIHINLYILSVVIFAHWLVPLYHFDKGVLINSPSWSLRYGDGLIKYAYGLMIPTRYLGCVPNVRVRGLSQIQVLTTYKERTYISWFWCF